MAIPKAEAKISMPVSSFTNAALPPRTLLPKQKPKPVVVKTMTVTITAYTVGDGSGYYAADGKRVYFGMLACPYSLKFGTKVRIPKLYGSKVFACHDRSATREGLVDVWVDSFPKAFAIGRQKQKIEIIK
jgi:3D (Asp-Asp-Asp) domain-containing protein